MTLVAIASSKGGVGKTTSAVSLASGLAQLYPVLLVDGDAQGHVALSYGLPVRSGLYDWLVTGLPLDDCTLSGRPAQLTILPGDSLTKTVERLYGTEQRFGELVKRLQSLTGDLAPVPPERSVGFVVVDTAAGGLFQEAALAAADQVVIPFEAETLSLDGVYATLELVRQLGPDADLWLLPVAFDRRLKEHRECLGSLVNEFGSAYGLGPIDDLYAARYIVPARSAVKECPALGKTIYEHTARGLDEVRVAYHLLIGRVLKAAGKDVEIEEEIVHGNNN
jgi:chromosome partitioning protein